MYSSFLKRAGKVGALIAAAAILPVLAYAGTDNGNGNGGQNNGQQNGHKHKDPVVPEVNAAWVLIPFVGAVLLYSWRRFSRASESH
jgi:hypothetical protein